MKFKLGYIFYILAVLSFVFGIITISNLSIGEIEKETKCYDRHSNEIIGQTCIATIYPNQELCLLICFLTAGLVIFFLVIGGNITYEGSY